MLVLSRRKRETVVLEIPPSTEWRTIEVVQCDVRGNVSRLGFVAPDEVNIVRSELNVDADAETVAPEPVTA